MAWHVQDVVAYNVPVCLLQSDYEAANFDVKKAKGYWQLGRLGLEETQELQAKVCSVFAARRPLPTCKDRQTACMVYRHASSRRHACSYVCSGHGITHAVHGSPGMPVWLLHAA